MIHPFLMMEKDIQEIDPPIEPGLMTNHQEKFAS
jgi:hypothetical protein